MGFRTGKSRGFDKNPDPIVTEFRPIKKSLTGVILQRFYVFRKSLKKPADKISGFLLFSRTFSKKIAAILDARDRDDPKKINL